MCFVCDQLFLLNTKCNGIGGISRKVAMGWDFVLIVRCYSGWLQYESHCFLRNFWDSIITSSLEDFSFWNVGSEKCYGRILAGHMIFLINC